MPIQQMQREFLFKEEKLPDPDPQMTPEEVISFYSGRYPELTAGTVAEQNTDGDKLIYKIKVGVGTKA